METKKFRCRYCRKLCLARVKNQKYCSEPQCQKARKNAWRRGKFASDADYRLNQKSSTEAWLSSVGGAAAYHRKYRRRKKQDDKAETRTESTINGLASAVESRSQFTTGGLKETGRANRDAIIEESRLKSGRYVISPLGAKRDAYVATIEIISTC